ncbi:MAG: hypothetical protein KKF44_06925 [Nanoarchaeota archaeon]|nr:hypothetical protein [Nanoarchaeota archaeon]
MKNTGIMAKQKVPSALRTWFRLHFFIDTFAAVPLMLFPIQFLGLLGWDMVTHSQQG